MSRRVLHLDTGSLMRGGQRQVLLLMRALRERGWENRLAAPPESALAARAGEEGFSLLPFNSLGDLDLRAALLLGRAAGGGDDVWHAHTARAHATASLCLHLRHRNQRPRFVVTRRTAFARRSGPLHGIKYRDRCVDAYVAISEAVAAGLTGLGVSAARVQLIPSAVDPESFLAAARQHLGETVEAPADFDPDSRRALRESLGFADDDFVVGAAGALDGSKGFDLLVAAASAATISEPHLHVVVAGEGPQRAALEGQLGRLGLGEHFRLIGPRDDWPRLLAAIDLFCMPSREEGLGSAVLEAFAAGLPVLASDAGGLAELVEPGVTGLRFPAENADALATALVAAARDREAGVEMAKRARAKVLREFGTSRMAEATERVYDSLRKQAVPKRAGAITGG